MAVPHTHCFHGHFGGKPGSAGCPLDSQSPAIPVLMLKHPHGSGWNSLYSLFEADKLDCSRSILDCSLT